MREIKFRAWDTVDKQWLWITAFETAETSKSEGYTLSGLFHDGDYIGDEGFVLMQYTGLKDKNGKEIYEGDIVTYPDTVGIYTSCGTEHEEVISTGVICWDDELAQFYVTNRESIDNDDFWEAIEDVEVIGNIYENPELLEGA